jgi:hypothetical protein
MTYESYSYIVYSHHVFFSKLLFEHICLHISYFKGNVSNYPQNLTLVNELFAKWDLKVLYNEKKLTPSVNRLQ